MQIGKIFFILGFLFLASCSEPKNTVIPSDQSKWESELKPKLDKLSDDEKKLVMGYLMRAKLGEAFGGGKFKEGTTIKDALESQRAWIAEEEKKSLEAKLLKEKLESERAALRKQIDELITVTVLKLKMEKSDYMTNQIIKLGFQNKSQKDISGVKGTVHFIDMFDKDVGSIGFSFTDGIKAGQTAKWEGSRHYNQFLPEHRALADLEEGKYKIRFEPEMIVFKDGSKLASQD